MDELTIGEAAARLHVDESSVRKRIRSGQMQARRAGARFWLIPRDEVERWQSLGKLRPGPPARTPEKERFHATSGERSHPPTAGAPSREAHALRHGTAESLLKYVGTWEGDDLEELLKEVYANRSQARF